MWWCWFEIPDCLMQRSPTVTMSVSHDHSPSLDHHSLSSSIIVVHQYPSLINQYYREQWFYRNIHLIHNFCSLFMSTKLSTRVGHQPDQRQPEYVMTDILGRIWADEYPNRLVGLPGSHGIMAGGGALGLASTERALPGAPSKFAHPYGC